MALRTNQPASAALAAAGAAVCFGLGWLAALEFADRDVVTEEDDVDDAEALLGGHSHYEITPSTFSTRMEARALDRKHSNSNLLAMTSSDYSKGTLGARNKLVVAMVGLPARGKSYIVKMLVRYLSWVGFPTRIFNAGELRRRRGNSGATADYFGSSVEATAKREELAVACQDEMYAWLREQPSSCVAIFDATNTTVERRRGLAQRCAREAAGAPGGLNLVFVESICDDPEVLERNYAMKLRNADYKDQDPAQALADFAKRVAEYERRYETVGDDEECSYVKLINVGDKVVSRRCGGYLTSQLSFYLGNIHITPRRIWLALHGESQLQKESKRVGASTGGLTPRGREFARRLAAFVKRAHAAFRAEQGGDPAGGVVVFTGNAPVHGETVRPLLADPGELEPAVSTSSLLNELCGGDFDGLSVRQIEDRYPAVWHRRMADKLRFRYPGAGGESYLDVISRLRPILIELERQRSSVLLVTHLAVQRCLYSYFTGTDAEAIPYLPLPAGAVIELTPTPHGTQVKTHVLLRDSEVVADVGPDPPSPAARRSRRASFGEGHT